MGMSRCMRRSMFSRIRMGQLTAEVTYVVTQAEDALVFFTSDRVGNGQAGNGDRLIKLSYLAGQKPHNHDPSGAYAPDGNARVRHSLSYCCQDSPAE